MKYVRYMETELGVIGIAENGHAITNVFFKPQTEIRSAETPCMIEKDSDLLLEAEQQVREYLMGERQSFDLVLEPEGTAFQRAVWNALQHIPYGTTESYGGIAAAIGNPRACRAVGMANNRNPIVIIIPCHRVIGTDGGLVGYGGGLHIKRQLLRIEGIQVK